MAMDGAGNIYLAGNVGEFLEGDVWVGKYDPLGQELWIETWGSTGDEYVRDLAVDALGNVFVVGDTRGVFGAEFYGGFSDAFLMKVSDLSSLIEP